MFKRYYKYICPEVKLMKLQFWFFIHRPLMISVSIVSIISFLIILSRDWKWVTTDSDKTNFSHSITGILTISFSIVQVSTFNAIRLKISLALLVG